MVFSHAANLAALLALIAVPFVFDSFTAYQLGLYLLYGMVAQGIALCWGRAGFLPLGQALFFGAGAYIAGFFLRMEAGWYPVIAGLLLAVTVPALVAGLLGALVFHRQTGSGPYFSLITLALSMLAYQLANSLEWLTGGFNGMTGISGLPGIDTYEHLYFYIVAALAGVTALLGWLMRAPFGQLLLATRENEERLQFFGFRTSLLKAGAFAISAGVAGLAGALYAPHQGIVTPQSVGFLLSAELVIWTAVGGRHFLAGPVIGAVLIGFLAAGLREHFRYWEVLVALVFIVVVLKLPGGLGSLVLLARNRLGLAHTHDRRGTRSESVAALSPLVAPDVEFADVSVSLGGVSILNGLSFRIREAGIHCIIGPNGAGKTSAFNALTGKLPIASGTVSLNGKVLNGSPSYRAARQGIGRKTQIPAVFGALSITQHVDIALWANRLSLRELFLLRPYRWTHPDLEKLEARFPFLQQGNVAAGSLSAGQRQVLDFSMTLLASPTLVLLDEPCAGLSSSETADMIAAIADQAANSQSTFVIIEHDMQVVERLSDYVLVMHQGELLARGELAEVRQDTAVQRVYSGGTK